MRPDDRRQRALLDAQLRHQTALRRMAGGSIDGRVEVAAPLPVRPRGEKYLPASDAVGQRSVTFVVAADNASDATKAAADYVCDGTNDHVEIQQALDAAQLFNRAGIVQLSEGVFNINADLVLGEDVWLRGAGPQATYVSGGDITVGTGSWSGIKISDLEVNGGITLATVSTTFVWIDSVYAHYVQASPLPGDVQWFWLTNCFLYGANASGYSLDLDGAAGVTGRSLWGIHIMNNTLEEGVQLTSSTAAADAGVYSHFVGNQVNGFSYFQNFDWIEVANNTFDAITFDSLDESTVAGNVVLGSFLVGGCLDSVFNNNLVSSDLDVLSSTLRCTFVGNRVEGFIRLDTSCHDNLVATNHCTRRLPNAPTTAHVTVAGDRNKISGNMFRADTGTRGWGVYIAATAADNMVDNNDGFGSWSLLAVNDLGTGTALSNNR
jgi:hypothetical protein